MIQVEHLTKCYGDFRAVDNLSFTLEDGHIYGFLGPNGAGKSTTMNIMTGCLSMTSGDVRIDGLDIFEDAKAAKKLIGYLPEIPPLYPDMTPVEYLYFVARAKGVSKRELEEQLRDVIEKAGIESVQGKLIKHLSKGFRQRVGLAQALLGNPKVIILDEPTVGLDPEQIIEMRNLIKALGKDHTVILSSHILSEVQAVCEKVLIIAHGRLIAFDEPENLVRHIDGNRASFEEAFIELTHSLSRDNTDSSAKAVPDEADETENGPVSDENAPASDEDDRPYADEPEENEPAANISEENEPAANMPYVNAAQKNRSGEKEENQCLQ